MMFFWNFPAVGPAREYQEKCQNLFKSFWNLQKNSVSLSVAVHPFFQTVAKSWPGYCSEWKQTSLKPENWNQEFSRYLQFLDQCWDKVLRSSSYSEQSAHYLESSIDFQACAKEFLEPFVQIFPFASKQDLEKLADKIHSFSTKK
jgi:hypothetical protein